MKMMEVRCCCDPGKLLGYLPMEDGSQYFSRKIAIPTNILVGQLPMPLSTAKLVINTITVHLPIATIVWRDGSERRALKSDDTPIETLRMLPEFVEAIDSKQGE